MDALKEAGAGSSVRISSQLSQSPTMDKRFSDKLFGLHRHDSATSHPLLAPCQWVMELHEEGPDTMYFGFVMYRRYDRFQM